MTLSVSPPLIYKVSPKVLPIAKSWRCCSYNDRPPPVLHRFRDDSHPLHDTMHTNRPTRQRLRLSGQISLFCQPENRQSTLSQQTCHLLSYSIMFHTNQQANGESFPSSANQKTTTVSQPDKLHLHQTNPSLHTRSYKPSISFANQISQLRSLMITSVQISSQLSLPSGQAVDHPDHSVVLALDLPRQRNENHNKKRPATAAEAFTNNRTREGNRKR